MGANQIQEVDDARFRAYVVRRLTETEYVPWVSDHAHSVLVHAEVMIDMLLASIPPALSDDLLSQINRDIADGDQSARYEKQLLDHWIVSRTSGRASSIAEVAPEIDHDQLVAASKELVCTLMLTALTSSPHRFAIVSEALAAEIGNQNFLALGCQVLMELAFEQLRAAAKTSEWDRQSDSSRTEVFKANLIRIKRGIESLELMTRTLGLRPPKRNRTGNIHPHASAEYLDIAAKVVTSIDALRQVFDASAPTLDRRAAEAQLVILQRRFDSALSVLTAPGQGLGDVMWELQRLNLLRRDGSSPVTGSPSKSQATSRDEPRPTRAEVSVLRSNLLSAFQDRTGLVFLGQRANELPDFRSLGPDFSREDKGAAFLVAMLTEYFRVSTEPALYEVLLRRADDFAQGGSRTDGRAWALVKGHLLTIGRERGWTGAG